MFFKKYTSICSDVWEQGPPWIGLKKDESVIGFIQKQNFTSLRSLLGFNKFHIILLLKKELTNRSFKLSAQQKHPVKYEWYVAFALLGESNSNSGLEMLWNSHPHKWDCWFVLPYKVLFMSRVLKPFYNTAVSLFYSLIKIAANIYFPVQFHFDCILKFYSKDQQANLR